MNDIFSWAWERRRKDGIPPDEPRFTMADVRNIFDNFAGEIISEKRIRQCEEDGIVAPSRTAGGHRKFSVTDVLCLYLCIKGCDHLSPEAAFQIVSLYRISRKQPNRFNPTVFDYDPSELEKGQIGNFINNPVVRKQIRGVQKLSKLIRRIDDFLEMNRFAKENGIAFKCHDDELLIIERAGMKLRIAPPLIEWRSVKKALYWRQFYIAQAKIEDRFPVTEAEAQIFHKKINKTILAWLLEQGHATRLNETNGD